MCAFLDFDWVGYFDTYVSTNGFYFLLGDACIPWISKKKPIMVTSSCEAKCIATFFEISRSMPT